MNQKFIGSKILSEFNDLKRTLESASKELGVNLSILNDAVKGELPKNELDDLLNRICSYYPININEFHFDEINPNDRFVHFLAEEALLTSRTYKRKNSKQENTDYYEYRDSATSRLSKFRPEWIRELRVVNNNDPLNNDVAYNNGHFMHQLTFFVGPVNFYYKYKGEYFCEEMNTGDSNYIPPFVPHSFTSRDKQKETYIVAVTFGGNFKNILPRVSALDNKMIDYINALITKREDLVLAKNETNNFKELQTDKTSAISESNITQKNSGVIVKRVKDYQLVKKSLYKAASSENYFSGARGFHIKSIFKDEFSLTNPCDSFLFNYGKESVILKNITLQKNIELKYGDSVFVVAGDDYKISINNSCSVFLVTLDLYLTPSIIDEIISFSDHNRLYEESRQWFT